MKNWLSNKLSIAIFSIIAKSFIYLAIFLIDNL